MKSIPKSGKRLRPKTAVRGKRYLCAVCRKRSPRPVKTPAPWYCPRCLAIMAEKRLREERIACGITAEVLPRKQDDG